MYEFSNIVLYENEKTEIFLKNIRNSLYYCSLSLLFVTIVYELY